MLILVLILSVGLATRNLHRFLAVSAPAPGGLLVLEGWASDAAFEAAINEFHSHHYDRLVVTGGPLEKGAPLSEYKTFAELSAATLYKMGLSTNEVRAVPAPRVRHDRTYAAALALRDWLKDNGPPPRRINLMTVGPHARRSRLLFEKALGGRIIVGVVALEPGDYDSEHWWRSSAGVRGTIGEALAYAYTVLFFHPRRESGE